MVDNLGTMEIVAIGKEGRCTYKFCKHEDHKIPSGTKIFRITTTYTGKLRKKNFHKECFGPWVRWMFDKVPNLSEIEDDA